MKKYTFILLAAALAVASCSRDAEKLFDKSAAVRAQEALEAADSALVQAPYGWEMLYFANTESRGYNLLCHFNRNVSVSMTGKNELTTGNVLKTDSNSTWDVRNEYGPILSFDTYNEVLHAWADPENDPWGDGYLGDYEFLILRNFTDAMILKGKKHSAYSYLRRLEEPVVAEEYYQKVEQMLSTLFKNDNILTAENNGKIYDLYNGAKSIFWLTKHLEPYKEDELELYPICSTMDGIVMSWGLPGVKDERVFTLTDGILVGENGTKISNGPLGDNIKRYTYRKNQGWIIDFANAQGALADSIAKAEASMKAKVAKAAVWAVSITFNDEQNLPSIAEDPDIVNHFRETVIRISYSTDGTKKKVSTAGDFRCKIASNGETITISDVQLHDKTTRQWATVATTKDLIAIAHGLEGTWTVSNAKDPFNSTLGVTFSGEGGSFTATGSTAIVK